MSSPLLGFKTPKQRSQAEQDAHVAAMQHLQYTVRLPCPTLAKGERFLITDLHGDPRVVADRGFKFSRIHQWTGSCVWAGGSNALHATTAAARCSANPIMAKFWFTLHNYAESRHYMGDDSQGNGSMGSTFFKSLGQDGVVVWDAANTKLPQYRDRGDDGVDVTGETVEYQWSSVRYPTVAETLALSKQHLVMSGQQLNDVQDVQAHVLNGYGVSFACDNFIGHGVQQSDGTVLGYWDHTGGHQQYVVGYQVHETLGPLYLAGNNWPKETYPITPMQPICFTWVTEAHVVSAMKNLDAEVFAIGRPDGFPAQPELLNYVY